jgi:myo-inositol 2-dehydrogenase/D-chiro-inositol 1-dehydrogenase
MTVRIGIIGPGGMGQAHIARITNLLSGGKVVAVSDLDLKRAKAVAEPLGATVYSDGAELTGAEEVDAIMVTSFGPAHEESVIAAIEAGKPVFCEKPLAPTAAACLRIMAAEEKTGRRLVQVGFMRRYDASYRQMKAVLDSGEIGEPLMVHCAHRNPTVPEIYTADMAINDTAIHEVDTMRWLLGEEFVTARVDRPKKTKNRFAHLQDPLILILESESGVRVDDEIFVNIRYAYDIRCEAVAETGTVSLADQNKIERRDSQGRHNELAVSHVDRFDGAFTSELQAWIRSVEIGQTSGPSSWDGYAAAAVCDAGVKALMGDAGTVVIEMIDRPAFYANDTSVDFG